MGNFKDGDRVRCIRGQRAHDLEEGVVYTVGATWSDFVSIKELKTLDFYSDRFVHWYHVIFLPGDWVMFATLPSNTVGWNFRPQLDRLYRVSSEMVDHKGLTQITDGDGNFISIESKLVELQGASYWSHISSSAPDESVKIGIQTDDLSELERVKEVKEVISIPAEIIPMGSEITVKLRFDGG